MYILLYILIPLIVSLLAVTWVSFKILDIVRQRDMMYVSSMSKRRRVPLPVLGGLAMMFGIVVALSISRLLFDCSHLLTTILAMSMMLYVGTINDIRGLSPHVRLLIEVGVALMLMYTCGYSFDHFHGLWGLQAIPQVVGIPLTIVAVIGLINAVRLIDGVDGYSSGFCIMACLVFGTFFAIAGDIPMVMLASVCVGSLLPFFFHSMFGKAGKMYIGNRGTLMMGVVMSVFVLNMLKASATCESYSSWGMGLLPFTLSIFSIPVFDTVRVMTARIVRGQSPFHPDKTHLHHLFTEMGFTHIATTCSLLLLNLMVIAAWYISCRLGASVDMQLYVVFIAAFLCTFCLYAVVRLCQRRFTCRAMRRGLFLRLRKAMDGK